MEGWLSATIQKDLDQVIGVTSCQTSGTLNRAREDDGSNIRTKASKPGVVQIVKWEKYNETFVAYVSDSVVRLKATFRSTAAEQHKKKTGKRITEETVGNIIQLEDAEIVATHIGPRTSKITLLIKRFRLIGSDTSGQIGDPRPFDATQEFDELLHKLSTFRKAEAGVSGANSSQESPDKHSLPRPRLGTFTPLNFNGYGSQQLFSQVPLRHDPSNAVAEKTKHQDSGGLRLPAGLNNQSERLVDLLKTTKAPKVKESSTSEHADPVAHNQPRQEEAKAEAPIELLRLEDTILKKAKFKKIRSRDLRIPKNQQDLLESEDSWLPAKPGHREPVAHVPPAVLEEWIRSAEAEIIKGQTGKPRDDAADALQDAADRPTEDEQEETSETQPDIPISSQDWPASPPARAPWSGHPPDSSPTAADSMDLSTGGMVQQDGRSPSDPPDPQYGVDQAEVLLSSPTEIQLEQMEDTNASESAAVIIDTAELNQHGHKNNLIPSPDLSDSESDIEPSVPLTLVEQAISASEPSGTQEVPATQPQEPFTQVKRTPYGAGGHGGPADAGTRSYSVPDRFSSPCKRRRADDSGRAYSVEPLECQTQTSSLEPDKIHGHSMFTVQTGMEETVLAHVTQPEACSTQHLPEPSETTSCPFSSMMDHREEIGPDEAEQPILSPYVSKRRRVHKPSVNFGFSQDELPKEDPSVTARRHREDYMAQRKASHPEARTSRYEMRPHNGSNLGKDRCTPTITPKQPEVTVEYRKHPLGMFEEPGNPATVIRGYEAGQDDDNAIRQRFHQEAISSESGVLPHESVKTTLLSADSEPNVSPQLHSPTSRQPQNPITTNLEQPQAVLENHTVQSSLNCISSRLEAISSVEISQQSNPSGQAQSLPELMTPAMSHSELLDVPIAAQHTDVQPAIYHRFKSIYPDYRGSKDDFVSMCKKIHQLLQRDRMEHKFLWDDFIIRYQTDYPQYLERCLKNCEDPKTYERFYRDEIDEPRFKCVIQPSTLGEPLPVDHTFIVAGESISMDITVGTGSPTTTPVVQRALSARNVSRSSPVSYAIDETSDKVPKASSHVPETGEDGNRRCKQKDRMKNSSKRRVAEHARLESGDTIDLTGIQSSSPAAEPPGLQTCPSPKVLVKKSPRRLPWLQDASTDSEYNSNLKAAIMPSSQSHGLSRLQPPCSLRMNQSASTPPNDSVKHSKAGFRRIERQASMARKENAEKEAARPPNVKPEEFIHDSGEEAYGLTVASEHQLPTLSAQVQNAESGPMNDPITPAKGAATPNSGQPDHLLANTDPTSLQGFAKTYMAIKRGRGNAWARDENGEINANSSNASVVRPIDAMSWTLRSALTKHNKSLRSRF
ncbi:MAG: hypothetical protein Q9209_001901 [Squamulea sp. 1 TL-2023]